MRRRHGWRGRQPSPSGLAPQCVPQHKGSSWTWQGQGPDLRALQDRLCHMPAVQCRARCCLLPASLSPCRMGDYEDQKGGLQKHLAWLQILQRYPCASSLWATEWGGGQESPGIPILCKDEDVLAHPVWPSLGGPPGSRCFTISFGGRGLCIQMRKPKLRRIPGSGLVSIVRKPDFLLWGT